MSKQQGEPGSEVHRLVDIVVEEVSLVDRAANQYQFLIVKRSDMAKENEADNGGSGAGAAAKATTVDAATLRASAVTALDGLTQAVEQLGADGDLDPETLNQIVADLQDVAQQLAQAAGMDPANVGAQKAGDGGEGDGEEEDAEEPAAASSKAADVLKSVRELLGQVKEQLTTAAKTEGTVASAAAGAGAGASPGAGAGAAPGAAGAGTALPAIDALTKTLEGIADSLKQQGQRLAKIEKQHGLPNSTPRAERTQRATGDDGKVRWPLDMNRPMDRESVDKTVSFHDAGPQEQ